MSKVYYQPVLPEEDWGVRLHSFEVYYDFMAAKRDFPDCVIAAYSGDDIEEPTYVDINEFNSEINVCSECGGTNVEYKAWVHCETGEFNEVSNDKEDTWCNDCQEHTGIEFKLL